MKCKWSPSFCQKLVKCLSYGLDHVRRGYAYTVIDGVVCRCKINDDVKRYELMCDWADVVAIARQA